MQSQLEELPESRMRLSVEVPLDAVKHAVEHAAADLSASVKIPGFRKGKVPMQVLISRIGKERLYAEAVDSHIEGWFRTALGSSRVRPITKPEYDYEPLASPDQPFAFKATFDVQPKVEIVDWAGLEVGRGEAAVPGELVDAELTTLRESVAELAPAARPAAEGDTLVVDLVSPSGEGQRDYVVEIGGGRLLDEIDRSLLGMTAGQTKEVEFELSDESKGTVSVTVKDIKERILPPLDDDLARAASEFDTLAELRADIEGRLKEQLEEEVDAQYRVAAIDRLAQASNVRPAEALVVARANELLTGLLRSLDRRGISVETYLTVTGTTPEQLRDGLRGEALVSVSRELALEAVADRLGLEIADEELKAFILEQAVDAGEDDPEEAVEELWQSGRHEGLREDLRLRAALDRVVAEVKPIPLELAAARDKLWTPEKGEQENTPADTKIWTPGQ